MGLFSGITDALGFTGGGRAGRRAQGDLMEIAEGLRNFRPIRVSSLAGTSRLTPEGFEFTPAEQFKGVQRQIGDLFGRSVSDLAAFNEGDITANVLGLLRQQRAPAFNRDLSRLESRLLQQGRLGLGTGETGANPELEGLFSAEAMADLQAQLAARGEARATAESLFGRAAQNFGLFQQAGMPDINAIFGISQPILNTAANAAQIASIGPQLASQAASREAALRAQYIGGPLVKNLGSFFGGLFS